MVVDEQPFKLQILGNTLDSRVKLTITEMYLKKVKILCACVRTCSCVISVNCSEQESFASVSN